MAPTQPQTYLGLDTSYYTTSVALVDGAGRLLVDERRPLSVPAGARGLAPSQAVWQHVRALPELLAAVLAEHRVGIAGVAASVAPRPAEGSYLPVFRVSEGFGRSTAAALGVPFIATTHQEGHVAAGLHDARTAAGEPISFGDEFLAIHLSGGTSELLRIRRRGAGFEEELLGWTRDLHAGQFVDRVGVALGLPFPAGPHLNRLAEQGTPGAVTVKSVVQGLEVSFSGPETQATGYIGRARPADIALAVCQCLARTLQKWLLAAREQTGLSDALVVGGVASNSILRERLSRKLEHPANGMRIAYGRPRLCTDNAVGVALIGRAAALTHR